MKIDSCRTLNNGLKMPIFGLGVYKSGDKTYEACRTAIEAGYKLIDTAALYQNEDQVGKAVKDSRVGRQNIFITTKIWNDDLRSGEVEKAFFKSLKNLDTDYVDLLLIHWPVKDRFVAAYSTMEKLYSKGLVKAIGVSNFLKPHLEELIPRCSVLPAVNQLEIHPYLTNVSEIDYCRAMGIAVEAWAPLAKALTLNDPVIKLLATKYGKTEAQIVIRWHLQKSIFVIPKSVTTSRIISNADSFDFVLSQNDMLIIDSLNKDMRLGSDPNSFDF